MADLPDADLPDPGSPGHMPDGEYAPSALPSTGARVLAFAAILLAGLCGGLIGYAVIDLQCEGDCTVASGIGGLAGAIVFAVGVGIVSVLALRAMGEWRVIQHNDARADDGRDADGRDADGRDADGTNAADG